MTADEIRARLKIRKSCAKGRGAKHSCARAAVVCLGCQRRVCNHFSKDVGHLDLESGELRRAVRFGELTARAAALLPVGVCSHCQRQRASVDAAHGVASLMELS